MGYRLIVVLLVILSLAFLKAPVASAHFPATDGTMTVVLHIDPDDQPVAGRPSTLNFIYEDLLNKFNAQKCLCQVAVYEQGRRVFNSPIPPTNGSPISIGSVTYSFPKADVYKINVTGSPKSGGNFKPFNVSWILRVPASASAYDGPSGYNKLYIVGFIVITVLCLGTFVFFMYRDFKET